MDPTTNQRWHAGLSPFDGDCLYTEDALLVEELRVLLRVVIDELRNDCANQDLFAFEDWHEHDGYIMSSKSATWSTLSGFVASAEALIASRHGDDFVYRAFYPADLSFLLRYDLPDIDTVKDRVDGTGFVGRFSLSTDRLKLAPIFAKLPLEVQSRLRVESAKSYFDRIYAG